MPSSPQPIYDQSYSLSQKIHQYIHQIDQKSHLIDLSLSSPLIKSLKFQCQMNKILSQQSTILQNSNKLYLFVCRSIIEDYSQLIIYEYKKQNGMNKSHQINGIKGKITCIKAQFAYFGDKRLDKQDCVGESKSKKKMEQQNINNNRLQIIIFIGTQKGYLKTIRFPTYSIKQQSNNYIPQLFSLRLDYSQISYILPLNIQYFNNINLCLILSKTNRVYLVNYQHMKIITIFMPIIVNCDVGLRLAMNYEDKYFVQVTQGGYVILWELSSYIFELIKKSKYGNQIIEKQIKQSKQSKQSKQHNNSFNSSQVFHSIVPISISHSLSIDGFIWVQLYGRLLIMITKKGILKLVGINNNKNINSDQYCLLMQYQIQDGELVSDVKFFEQSNQIFIVKSQIYSDRLNKINNLSTLKTFDMKKDLKKSNYSKQIKPYKPLNYNDMKKNYYPKNDIIKQKDKCYFQKLKFNNQLEIQQVIKIYPKHRIQNIQSLQISEDKDIVILRASQFYLIGQTNLLKIQE